MQKILCEEKWKNVINSLPHGILLLNQKKQIKYCNGYLKDILEMKNEENICFSMINNKLGKLN